MVFALCLPEATAPLKAWYIFLTLPLSHCGYEAIHSLLPILTHVLEDSPLCFKAYAFVPWAIYGASADPTDLVHFSCAPGPTCHTL